MVDLRVLIWAALALVMGWTSAVAQPPPVPLNKLWAGRDSLPEGSLFAEFRAYKESRRFVAEPILAGEALPAFLVRMGLTEDDAALAAETFFDAAGVEALPAGTSVRLKFRESQLTPAQIAAGGGIRGLEAMEVLLLPNQLVALARKEGGFEADTRIVELETRYVAAAAEINQSLFAAAQGAKVPRDLMIRFADVFAFDVDFGRDIYRGDRFEIVYEVKYDQYGQELGVGDIVFAALTWRGGRFSQGYYLFADETYDVDGYFSAEGRDPRTLLMKIPINGARVTSRFGRRRHPVLGYNQGHKGVDFGAPRGTPIMAAGDGTVKIAGPRGTFGNYIQLDHGEGLETAYAHLQRFAPGITAGAKVRQGDVIGYVGTTGRSTGPHLHYEVWQGGEPQNPETIKVAVGQTLDGQARQAFTDRREIADDLRIKPFAVAEVSLPPQAP